MCGIAVSVDLMRLGRAEPWALDLIRHRGPDGQGRMVDPDRYISLEHSRLAVIDPENPEADQPFSDPSGRWTIVYNGELFNFRELRRELEASGVEFRTNSDTEVLLLGYVHLGRAFVERLRGMFAFVIWDRQTGEVFAARDQIGVKPFYYFVSNGIFAACSEVRPLLAHRELRVAFDPPGVVEFLAFGGNPSERTILDGIRKLLPGHCLRIQEERVIVEEYWDATPAPGAASAGKPSAELLDRLDDAVSAAVVSDVPLGLMLSGGVDSSTIASLAVRHVDASALTAYSVAFGRPDDEVDAAGRLARELGIKLRTLSVSEDDVRGEFDEWLTDLDYPAGNPTWIASSFIARAARADGIKVLLSGDGGDELFGGYTRWMKYLRFHDRVWARTPRRARRIAGSVARRGVQGLAGDIARRASSDGDLFVPSRPFHDDLLHTCLGSVGRTAACTHPPETRIQELRRQFDERFPGADYLAWMSYVSLKTKLVEDFLQRLDKMGMRHSVEGRVPLLDPEVARWALGTPQGVKVPGYRQKAILRAAVEPVLPPYVLDRPKQGFCPPVSSWCEQLLVNRGLPNRGPLFDGELLAHQGAVSLRARGDGASFALWTLGILVEWSNRNLPSADILDVELAAV